MEKEGCIGLAVLGVISLVSVVVTIVTSTERLTGSFSALPESDLIINDK
jgi:hypothetical protein